jgi:hypothetical protein
MALALLIWPSTAEQLRQAATIWQAKPVVADGCCLSVMIILIVWPAVDGLMGCYLA